MTALIIIGIIVLVFIIYIVKTYNGLIAEIETVKNSERQIDIQLDRRFKIFESLINVVNKYMDYEKTVLKDVTRLRQQSTDAKSSGDPQARMQAENSLSSISKGINVQFEAYPDLKANQNVLQLQEEITATENKLAFSKQAFNDSIERYNAHKKSIFAGMVVNFFKSKLDNVFTYWNITEEKRDEMEDYTVKL
ncbi:MAG: LemA protein [Francisellaceae bacterium]|jgi:LemA protein